MVSAGYMYPPFLTGSMTVAFREELGFGRSDIGVFIAVFFCVGAVLMPAGGRLADRKLQTSMRVGLLCSGACLVAVSLLGDTRTGWYIAMAIGGLGAAFVAPVGGLLVVRGVPRSRTRMGFAIERASIPASTLLAGLTVATVAPVAPWRVVFAGAGLVVACIAVAKVPEHTRRAAPSPDHAVQRQRGERTLGPLITVTVAFALCAAATGGLSAFFVDYGVMVGLSAQQAGLALAAGSGATIVARLALGAVGTRLYGRRTVVAMMVVGALGFAVLAAPALPALALGVLLAYGAGWGWTGALSHAVVTAHDRSAGFATGILQTGGSVGGVLGPLVLAVVVDRLDYSTGWLVAAGALTLAAVLTTAARPLWLTESRA